jgi:hypothetical protein
MVAAGDPWAGYTPEDRYAVAVSQAAIRGIRQKMGDLATVITMDQQLSLDEPRDALAAAVACAAHARETARQLGEMADELERILEICLRYET